MKFRSAIDLRLADVRALNEIAAALGCTARAGITYGKPSWRALSRTSRLENSKS